MHKSIATRSRGDASQHSNHIKRHHCIMMKATIPPILQVSISVPPTKVWCTQVGRERDRRADD